MADQCCGNPKRYKTQEVIRMGFMGKKGDKKGGMLLDDILETEGERHLQTLAKKQINTDITLKQQIAQHRTFKPAGEYDPETRNLSGITQLADYKSVGSRDVYIEELKQCGLTEEEIELKLSFDSNGKNYARTYKSKYGANPQTQQERLQKLELKITETRKQLSKPDTFSGVVHLGRHQMELEKSLININKETKIISNALTKEGAHIIGDPNDPINQLPDILKDVQNKAKQDSIRRRKRQHGPSTRVSADTVQIDRPSELIGPLPIGHYNKHPHASSTNAFGDTVQTEEPSEFIGPLPLDYRDKLCEVTTLQDTESNMFNQPIPNPIPVTQVNKKSRAGSLERYDSTVNLHNTSDDNTTYDNIDASVGRRELKTKIEFVPEDVIKKYRLTENEIRNLPRFENYTCGDPNNVLYLKNLSSVVTEEDLVSLFGRFQKMDSNIIIYKLITGRMRGQAFITFPDIPTAERALHLVNGYHFKGKPVIIQFGKKA